MKLKENTLDLINQQLIALKSILNMYEQDAYTVDMQPHVIQNIKDKIKLLSSLISD